MHLTREKPRILKRCHFFFSPYTLWCIEPQKMCRTDWKIVSTASSPESRSCAAKPCDGGRERHASGWTRRRRTAANDRERMFHHHRRRTVGRVEPSPLTRYPAPRAAAGVDGCRLALLRRRRRWRPRFELVVWNRSRSGWCQDGSIGGGSDGVALTLTPLGATVLKPHLDNHGKRNKRLQTFYVFLWEII